MLFSRKAGKRGSVPHQLMVKIENRENTIRRLLELTRWQDSEIETLGKTVGHLQDLVRKLRSSEVISVIELEKFVNGFRFTGIDEDSIRDRMREETESLIDECHEKARM